MLGGLQFGAGGVQVLVTQDQFLAESGEGRKRRRLSLEQQDVNWQFDVDRPWATAHRLPVGHVQHRDDVVMPACKELRLGHRPHQRLLVNVVQLISAALVAAYAATQYQHRYTV